MTAGTEVLTDLADIGADLFLSRIGTVDDGVDAAHQGHTAVQLLLEGCNVVGVQHTLPHVDAQVNHIFHNALTPAVGMVQDDDTVVLHVLVHLHILGLDELAPHSRADEHGVLAAPIVMGNDDIGMEVVHQQLGVLEAVLTDGFQQFQGILRLLVQSHAQVGDAHQVVSLLPNTGTHEGHNQMLIAVNGGSSSLGVLPQLRSGAVGNQIGNLNGFLPLGNIGADQIIFAGEGEHLGLGPQVGGAPTVLDGAALLAHTAGVALNRVDHNRLGKFVVVDQAVGLAIRLQGFQKILLGGKHRKSPPYCFG